MSTITKPVRPFSKFRKLNKKRGQRCDPSVKEQILDELRVLGKKKYTALETVLLSRRSSTNRVQDVNHKIDDVEPDGADVAAFGLTKP